MVSACWILIWGLSRELLRYNGGGQSSLLLMDGKRKKERKKKKKRKKKEKVFIDVIDLSWIFLYG